MNLVRLGGFPWLDRYWFWDTSNGFLVDVLFDGDRCSVRCVAGFRLLGQAEGGRELWVRNLSKMSRYLKDSFSQCRFSVDFSDSVNSEMVGVKGEAESVASELDGLLDRKDVLEERIESLEKSLDLGSGEGSLQGSVEQRLDECYEELDQVSGEIESLVDRLEFLQVLLSEWRSKGYGVSVCFSVATGFEKVRQEEFRGVVSRQLQELKDRCDRSVKQKLSGENFRLQFSELDTPHQLLQHLYTPLAHPGNDVDDERVQELLSMYMAFAGEDLEVDGAVRHEEKAGAARSLNAVLQYLDSTGSGNAADVESSGPLLGNVRGTEMGFGVDPADQPHFYIVGATGSGKSYTKRVLLENCLALGYDVVSVTPRDLQAVSAFKSFDSDGSGLTGDYYLPGSDLLLDEPSDFSDLFSGRSFVSLMDLSETERNEFVVELFDAAADLGKTSNPVFVFLDEAHLFSDGAAADSIQEAVREVRKFGVHVVLATQSPMDFNRSYKHIRQNTVANLFLQGEYWDYAENYLTGRDSITSLNQGEAWFTGRGFDNVLLDVRKPLSRVEEVNREDLKEIDGLFSFSSPEISDSVEDSVDSGDSAVGQGLSDEQRQVVEAIREYIDENDMAPSKNKVIECSPFGSTRSNRVIDELLDLGAVVTDSDERYGNEATVFRIN